MLVLYYIYDVHMSLPNTTPLVINLYLPNTPPIVTPTANSNLSPKAYTQSTSRT